MNSVELVGRLSRDPDVRYTGGENASASCRFNMAVTRKFKNKETNQYDADFIGCVAFGSTADFIGKWFHKGDPIGITGRIQTGSYTNKDGIKVYTTDVVAENVEFVGSKSSGAGEQSVQPTAQKNDDWMNIPQNAGEELPF